MAKVTDASRVIRFIPARFQDQTRARKSGLIATLAYNWCWLHMITCVQEAGTKDRGQ